MCSAIVRAVLGLAVSLMTGSIGLPITVSSYQERQMGKTSNFQKQAKLLRGMVDDMGLEPTASSLRTRQHSR